MNQEKSCGAVIYFDSLDTFEYLLIQYRYNRHYWGFVKGHVEKGENELQTAIREIEEEVGIKDLTIMPNFRHVHDYHTTPFTHKEVVFFIAKAWHQKVIPCPSEVMNYQWLGYIEAMKRLTYENDKILLKLAHQKIGLEPNQ